MLCGRGYFLAGWVRRGSPARVAKGGLVGTPKTHYLLVYMLFEVLKNRTFVQCALEFRLVLSMGCGNLYPMTLVKGSGLCSLRLSWLSHLRKIKENGVKEKDDFIPLWKESWPRQSLPMSGEVFLLLDPTFYKKCDGGFEMDAWQKKYSRYHHVMSSPGMSKFGLITGLGSLLYARPIDLFFSLRLVQEIGIVLPSHIFGLRCGSYVLPQKVHGQLSGDSVTLSSDRCHWRPPDSRKFKLNVDAAWNVDSLCAGGLIRNQQGQV
ncbi:hypothetical protein M9H77_12584 [Catharanthus roseus]|uniref:Uncharacterized protein n=1 Tax=Catharanthus roseus TaxID=4058 RepID=A0ACC0BHU2_CATRO|nr:hypothetical protein M9H77_12584 [Catharanthus roseus]